MGIQCNRECLPTNVMAWDRHSAIKMEKAMCSLLRDLLSCLGFPSVTRSRQVLRDTEGRSAHAAYFKAATCAARGPMFGFERFWPSELETGVPTHRPGSPVEAEPGWVCEMQTLSVLVQLGHFLLVTVLELPHL